MPNEQPKTAPASYKSIQALRAIAAILVVLMHQIFYYDANLIYLKEATPKISSFYEFKSFGMAGVHLFFVISGFVMALIYEAKPMQGPARFVKDRVIRIVPLYWIATIAWVLVHAPGTYTNTSIIKAMLFVPTAEFFPVLGVGWSLNYEMFFYAIFTIAVIAFKRSIYVMAIPLALSVIAGHYFPGTLSTFYGNPIILEFLAGIVIFKIHRLGCLKNSGHILFWSGIISLLSSVVYLHGGSFLAKNPVIPWGIPSALIVLGATVLDFNGKTYGVLRSRALQLLGAASYSIYLSHPISGLFTDAIIVYDWRLQSFFGSDGAIFLLTACCCLTGIAVHKIVEQPCIRLIKKLFPDSPKPQAATKLSI
jgi:exopolysaccharide production protein ExoZ